MTSSNLQVFQKTANQEAGLRLQKVKAYQQQRQQELAKDKDLVFER
jgi:phosphoglycerol transferase MdoB-like AlkP superfamily enzyme